MIIFPINLIIYYITKYIVMLMNVYFSSGNNINNRI